MHDTCRHWLWPYKCSRDTCTCTCTYCIAGIFGGGKIFVSSELLASSWKNFRGRGILNHTPVLCGTVSWVKISWFASQPRKPRIFNPPEKYPLYGSHLTLFLRQFHPEFEGVLHEFKDWWSHFQAFHQSMQTTIPLPVEDSNIKWGTCTWYKVNFDNLFRELHIYTCTCTHCRLVYGWLNGKNGLCTALPAELPLPITVLNKGVISVVVLTMYVCTRYVYMYIYTCTSQWALFT